MTITPDRYFFAVLDCWILGGLLFAAFVYACAQYVWVRRWILPIVGLMGVSYDLVQCSELTARSYRPAVSNSTGEK